MNENDVQIKKNKNIPERSKDEVNYSGKILDMVLPDFNPFEYDIFLALSQQVNVITENGIKADGKTLYAGSLNDMRAVLDLKGRKISNKKFLVALDNVTDKLGQLKLINRVNGVYKYEKYMLFSGIVVDAEQDVIELAINPATLDLWTELTRVVRPSITHVRQFKNKYSKRMYLDLLGFQDTGHREMDYDVFLDKIGAPIGYRKDRYRYLVESRILNEKVLGELNEYFPELKYVIEDKKSGGHTIFFNWVPTKKGRKYVKEEQEVLPSNKQAKLNGHQIGECLDVIQLNGYDDQGGKKYLVSADDSGSGNDRNGVYESIQQSGVKLYNLKDVYEYIAGTLPGALRSEPNVDTRRRQGLIQENPVDYSQVVVEPATQEEIEEANKALEKLRRDRDQKQ